MHDDPGLQGVQVPFDSIGELYDELFTDRSAQLAAGQWVLENTAPGDRVLDLGCGTGMPTAEQLSRAGRAVVAVDNSERMLAIGRLKLPEVEFLHRDFRSLPAKPGSYQAVVAFFSLLMLPKREIETVLGDIARLLTPGGPFALAMVEGDLDGVTIPLLGTEATVSAYSRDELVRVVEQAGFEVVGVDELSVDFDDRVENQLYLRAKAAA